MPKPKQSAGGSDAVFSIIGNQLERIQITKEHVTKHLDDIKGLIQTIDPRNAYFDWEQAFYKLFDDVQLMCNYISSMKSKTYIDFTKNQPFAIEKIPILCDKVARMIALYKQAKGVIDAFKPIYIDKINSSARMIERLANSYSYPSAIDGLGMEPQWRKRFSEPDYMKLRMLYRLDGVPAAPLPAAQVIKSKRSSTPMSLTQSKRSPSL